MVKNSISVEVLLPTYNGAKFLAEQVESILGQTYPHIKLLIRDDGSTDSTPQIIKEFAEKDSRVVVVKDNDGNLGLVKSIEKLMTISTAEVLFFADQDDYWMEDKIDHFLENYNDRACPTLIHSDCYVTNEKLEGRTLFIGDISHKVGLKDALFHYFVQGASTMINRQLKEILLPFPAECYIHDRYFHLMSELNGSRIYLNKPTMYYRQHGGNLIGSQSFFKKILNNLNLKKLYIEQDKNLIYSILHKNPEHPLLLVYQQLTSPANSRWKKIKLLSDHKITLRVKELILLLLRN